MTAKYKYGYGEYYEACRCTNLRDKCQPCRFRECNPPPKPPLWYVCFAVFTIVYIVALLHSNPDVPLPYMDHDEIYDGVNNYTDQVCE